MKFNEIKKSNAEELERSLSEAKAKIVDLKFKAASGSLKKVNEIGNARKYIARILTRLHQIKHNKDSK